MGRSRRYILWTLLVSYIYAAFSYYIIGARTGSSYLIMATIYMWIPAIITIILMKTEKRNLKELGIIFRPNRWFLFAWLIFLFLALLVIPVNSALPGVEFSATMDDFFDQYQDLMTPEQFEESRNLAVNNPILPFLIMIAQGLFAGITINAFFGFGEELGWRGYLYREFEKLGFWKASFITGVIWGIWHAPLIIQGHNYPGYPVIGVIMMVIWCVLLAPLFTLIRSRSGSVIAAAVGHGTLNGIIGISFVYVAGGNVLTNGLLGIS